MKLTTNKPPYKKKEFENKKAFIPRQILQSEDRCHKCGDSKHIEGFQYSAHKYQCRNCPKFGHFSSLCYKKQESYKRPRSPKAYQLTSGRLSTQNNAICSHSSDNSSSDESFCLQMKVQAEQANAKYPTPQHLVTNLEFKVKPHKNKPKFPHTLMLTLCLVVFVNYCLKIQIIQSLHQVIYN